MIIINTEKALNNATALVNELNSTIILKQSFSILKLNKKTWLRKIVFLFIEIHIAYLISSQSNTVFLTKEAISIILSIIIALLAIVFTGYAFFQALLSDNLLITLLSVDTDEDANLSNTNKYFAKVMTFQIFCILLDLIVVVFTTVVPENWCLFSDNSTNEVISTFCLSAIMHISFESVWEMKSFIFNVFQLFNLHAYSRIAEIKEKLDNQN